MKPHAKTIARGLARWVSQHRPSESETATRLTVKSHESSLFRGLLTHSYFSLEYFSKDNFKRKKNILLFKDWWRKRKHPRIIIITWRTLHARERRERPLTLVFHGSAQPRSRRKVSALFEKIISRSRSIIALSERRAGCLLERIVVLAANNYHFAAKLI